MVGDKLRKAFAREILCLSFVLVAIFVCLWVVVRVKFGLVSHAARWLNGERVFLSMPVMDLGELSSGDHRIRVTVVNCHGESAKLVGGEADCKCLHFVGLPLEIPAGMSRDAELIVSVGSDGAPESHKFLFFTDVPGHDRIGGTLRWHD